MLTDTGNGLTGHITAVLHTLVDTDLPDIGAFAVLEGNGNVILIVELAATSDLPLPPLRSATVLACADTGSTRIDGVLFFYPRHERGPRMVFFDRDGTWEAMCGNGLRCVTRYAADAGLIDRAGVIETDDGPKAVRVDGRRVRVTLGPAREVCRIDDERWFAYTGVAHLVVFVANAARLEEIDVPREGATLRYDAALCRRLRHPEGLHVNFVAVTGDTLAIRTYEVGVEDETPCCGTGAVASAYLAWHTGRVPRPDTTPTLLHTRGGVVEVDARDGRLRLAGDVGYLVGRRPVVTTAPQPVDVGDRR